MTRYTEVGQPVCRAQVPVIVAERPEGLVGFAVLSVEPTKDVAEGALHRVTWGAWMPAAEWPGIGHAWMGATYLVAFPRLVELPTDLLLSRGDLPFVVPVTKLFYRRWHPQARRVPRVTHVATGVVQ